MSLKAVELQMALPRTQEISRIQDQQQQKHLHEQQHTIDHRKQLDEAIRQRPTDVEQTAKNQIREREKRQHKQKKRAVTDTVETGQGGSPGTRSANTGMRDPLRGRHIDITL
jgi:hypothetical protein